MQCPTTGSIVQREEARAHRHTGEILVRSSTPKIIIFLQANQCPNGYEPKNIQMSTLADFHALVFRLRSTWIEEVQNSNCVVYVIDSSDRMRLQLAKDELFALQTQVLDFKERKVIVLLTKADHPNAISKSCIQKEVDFSEIYAKILSFSARKNKDVKSLLDRCIGVL